MGYLLLEGGAEFGGEMAAADRRALDLAGGDDAPVDIVPAAAAPDGNHERAGRHGVLWFQGLGARKVVSRPLIDEVSARRPEIADALCRSRLVFLLGGFPAHLAASLLDTPCQDSMLSVVKTGGVVGGSSAGAMVLCDAFYDPKTDRLRKGLGLLPGAVIIPHHDTYGSRWVGRLRDMLPDTLLVGIDEETGLINDAPGGGWTVYGKGGATLHGRSQRRSYAAGKRIPGDELQMPVG